MVDIRKIRTCEVCKTDVPATQVKLFPKDRERNWMLCSPCCDKMKNRASAKAADTPRGVKKELIRNVYERTVTKQEKGEATDYKVLFCTRCNYNFKVDKSRAGVFFNLNCPYCGKDDQIRK